MLIETTQIRGVEECQILNRQVERNRAELERQKLIKSTFGANVERGKVVQDLREKFDV